MSTPKQLRVEDGYEETEHARLSLIGKLEEIKKNNPAHTVTVGNEVITIPEAISDLEQETPRSLLIVESFQLGNEY